MQHGKTERQPFLKVTIPEPVIPQFRVGMTVPRLGDLPEPVLELLMMLGETWRKNESDAKSHHV